MRLVQVKDKAEALGVISGSGQKENEDNGKGNVKKVKPPDKDTMTVKVPLQKEHSASSIGPIWNDAASTSKDSQVSSHHYTVNADLGILQNYPSSVGGYLCCQIEKQLTMCRKLPFPMHNGSAARSAQHGRVLCTDCGLLRLWRD